jgi:hypothetical protein
MRQRYPKFRQAQAVRGPFHRGQVLTFRRVRDRYVGKLAIAVCIGIVLGWMLALRT